jgi:2-phospho-L-lactate guanylyltransferase
VNVHAIVPQKPLAAAKGRLRSVLHAPARAALSLQLLKTVCTVLKAVAGIDSITVMTPDPLVRTYAAAWGVRTMPDPYPELNAGLAGVFTALSSKAHGILVIAADLPMIQPADVIALLAKGGPGTLVLGPSKDGMGTNALLIPPGVPINPAYGDRSLAAHRDRARLAGLRVIEVRRPGLAFDLDSPADLAALPFHSQVGDIVRLHGGRRSRAFQ